MLIFVYCVIEVIISN